MLLTFSVTNYRSIKETETLSLVAGRERKNADRLISIKTLRKRALPVAMIQGKNGAGKTNIIKALQAAQQTIALTKQPNEKLDAIPFRLCNNCLSKATEFAFEFMIAGTVYRYEFSMTRDAIQKESLFVVKLNSNDIFFTRVGQNIMVGSLADDESEKNDLRIIAQGTRNNQLFLNALAIQAENVQKYSWSHAIGQIFNWFAKGISILRPDMNLTLSDADKIDFLTKTIPLFDTGVDSVKLVELSKEAINIPSDLLQNILNMMPEDGVFPLLHPNRGPVFIRKINGEASLCEVNTTHRSDTGEPINFNLSDESDGTFRLMSLLTFLSSFCNQNEGKVLVIDEIERSLHSALTKKIIKDFLRWAQKKYVGQIIFSSHDSTLMNDDLGLRRDEMWIADKGTDGETRLFSLASRNVQRSGESGLRTGMNLADEFLSGKLGGIANTQERNFFENR